MRLQWTKNASLMEFSTFVKKFIIFEALTTLKKSWLPLNLSHRDDSFKYPYKNIWSDKFYNKKGETIEVLLFKYVDYGQKSQFCFELILF